MPSCPRPSRLVLSVALVVVLVAACGSSAPKPGAAEPANSPALTATPAGTLHPVGAQPEGIVYDPATKLVAVAVRGPDRLQLLDGPPLAVARTVPLPGSARHLQLAGPGGPVLVPDETTNQLIEVSLPDGQLRATGVGKQPHDAAASGGDIVVGNEFGRSISILRDGAVLATLGGVQQPGGVIGDGSTVGVVDVGAFTVSTYNLTTRKQIAVKRAGKGPTHGVLANNQRLVVADTRGNAMLVYSVSPLEQIGHLALPGTPYGLAFDAVTDTVWVTLTALNEVVGLDVSGNTPKIVARYPSVRQPNTIAVAPGAHTLWVAGVAAGTVEQISR
jgi:DNA-binding beta-propeller fold protein YncE